MKINETEITWNGIELICNYHLEHEEDADLQLVNPSDLNNFAHYVCGNRNYMDEIAELIRQSEEDDNEHRMDFYNTLKQDR